MGRTACTEPRCLYKGDLYLYFYSHHLGMQTGHFTAVYQLKFCIFCFLSYPNPSYMLRPPTVTLIQFLTVVSATFKCTRIFIHYKLQHSHHYICYSHQPWNFQMKVDIHFLFLPYKLHLQFSSLYNYYYFPMTGTLIVYHWPTRPRKAKC